MDQGTCRDENDEISENFGIIFLNVGTWIVIDHAKANSTVLIKLVEPEARGNFNVTFWNN